jgi:hypothetical protein
MVSYSTVDYYYKSSCARESRYRTVGTVKGSIYRKSLDKTAAPHLQAPADCTVTVRREAIRCGTSAVHHGYCRAI